MHAVIEEASQALVCIGDECPMHLQDAPRGCGQPPIPIFFDPVTNEYGIKSKTYSTRVFHCPFCGAKRVRECFRIGVTRVVVQPDDPDNLDGASFEVICTYVTPAGAPQLIETLRQAIERANGQLARRAAKKCAQDAALSTRLRSSR